MDKSKAHGGCPHCSNNQSWGRQRLISYLETVKLKLLSRNKPTYKAKEILKLLCVQCDKKFSQNIDRLRSGNIRGCDCKKHVWHHFENLVREVYGGVSATVGELKCECVIAEKQIAIEAKHGPQSLKERGLTY